jgi:hypothetical protein
MVETGEHNLPGVNEKPDKPKKKNRGCLIGCLGLIVLFFINSVITMKLTAPQYFGDKDKVIEDIYRYKERYGNWPQSLEELKSKLPDYHFKHDYGYSHNDDMFIVSFWGKGLAGEDLGDFYRSDTKEWKSIYENIKEYQLLEKNFFPKNNR